MPVTFPVDNVELEGDAYPVVTLERSLSGRMGDGLKVSWGPDSVLATDNETHPLVNAVHLAFAKHRPLVLAPDAIWTTIAQGFSTHVQAHAEQLRERFVKHQDKLVLQLEHLNDDVESAAWPGLVQEFTTKIREHVGPGLHRLLGNDFSTTGESERLAGEIVMMETFKPYFDYRVMCICGIPTITLTGTVNDWRTIRRRLDVIAEYGLADWIARLAPVADEWVKTAEGHPDREFWQCIYKPKKVYAAETATGWLLRLFPYLVADKKAVRNESLYGISSDPHEENWDDQEEEDNANPMWCHRGVRVSSFGTGLSVAPVTVEYMDGRPPKHIQLLGGFVGITQDPATLALEPKLGACVRFDRVTTAIEAIAATAKPAPLVDDELGLASLPGAYQQLLHRLANSRLLFDGEWTLRTPAQVVRICPTEENRHARPWYCVTAFADLPDGRWLAWYETDSAWKIVAGRGDVLPKLDTPVLAGDFIDLLERALREGPLFFDASSFQAEKTLSDVVRH